MAIGKKEFNLIAKRLAAIRPPIDEGTAYNYGKYKMFNEVVIELFELFSILNERFDKVKFRQACED